jgi:hypothetical protein
VPSLSEGFPSLEELVGHNTNFAVITDGDFQPFLELISIAHRPRDVGSLQHSPVADNPAPSHGEAHHYSYSTLQDASVSLLWLSFFLANYQNPSCISF